MGQDEIKNMLKVLGRGLGMLLAALFLSGFEKRGERGGRRGEKKYKITFAFGSFHWSHICQNQVIRTRS